MSPFNAGAATAPTRTGSRSPPGGGRSSGARGPRRGSSSPGLGPETRAPRGPPKPRWSPEAARWTHPRQWHVPCSLFRRVVSRVRPRDNTRRKNITGTDPPATRATHLPQAPRGARDAGAPARVAGASACGAALTGARSAPATLTPPWSAPLGAQVAPRAARRGALRLPRMPPRASRLDRGSWARLTALRWGGAGRMSKRNTTAPRASPARCGARGVRTDRN